MAERSRLAIRQAVKALKKRHALEEGAHAPALFALSRTFDSQGEVWKEKSESLELELQQCYKAQSRLSEQLVDEVSECRKLKAQNQEKDVLINRLNSELHSARERAEQLEGMLEKKSSALDLTTSENHELRKQVADLSAKLSSVTAENTMLIDRWMLHKMQESEKLNEAPETGRFSMKPVGRSGEKRPVRYGTDHFRFRMAVWIGWVPNRSDQPVFPEPDQF